MFMGSENIRQLTGWFLHRLLYSFNAVVFQKILVFVHMGSTKLLTFYFGNFSGFLVPLKSPSKPTYFPLSFFKSRLIFLLILIL